MDLQNMILSFALGAKNAQVVLNQKTGDELADVPIAIREFRVLYSLECNLEFTTDLTVKFRGMFVSGESKTTFKSERKERIEMEIKFESAALIAAEVSK